MTEATEIQLEPRALDGPGTGPTTVVGIGASAGGLEALQRFFESVEADTGMAYVVIMHLDRSRESQIAPLLQVRSVVPVAQVIEETMLQADHAYVIAPTHDLEVRGRSIRGVERAERQQHTPIDLLFSTLAAAYGPNAVGVVLSGTGSDGTDGIRQIREAGGITVAQEPAEAGESAMPRAAIASGHVDLILAAVRIPGELYRLQRLPALLSPDGVQRGNESSLAHVYATLRAKSGHDFSQYKRATVLRRLERRLHFNGVETIEAYLPVLRSSEGEWRALVRDLLISVSGFFRDPEAFEALQGVIPGLFEGKGPQDAVRVWVAGCATGEEAYSIAILLSEYAATQAQPPRVQIFATDIDEQGYKWGRDAIYPAAAVAQVPPERLAHYFTREAEGFRVTKALRESVLFAVHNVLRDPPFSRLDLVSCRNLLIYLQPEAQEQVIETFHFALQPGGILFLGTSETTRESGHFTPVVSRQRVYRRDEARYNARPRPSAADPGPRPTTRAGEPGEANAPAFSYGRTHLHMLEAYAPPSLVVDEKLHVVHRSSGVGRYLHLGEGEPSDKLIELTRGDLRMELRTALYQAFELGLGTSRQVRVRGAVDRSILVHVRPFDGGDHHGRFGLVVFEEQPEADAAEGTGVEPPVEKPVRPSLQPLEEELRRTREQLDLTIASHDQALQELQSTNEELRSINEEERAAAEELETSREEIQSINEELTTINQEHRATIEQLGRTNADLENLIASTDIGTVLLDGQMRIRRFTPAVQRIFNFAATDVGRPLADITNRMRDVGFDGAAREVMASRAPSEQLVQSEDGDWYIARISPYRVPDAGDGRSVGGVVIAFFDVTAHKRLEDELRTAKVVAEEANRAKGAFLATLSHEFRTPLTGILGYTQLLGVGAPLTEGQERKVERIEAGVWHLNSMIDEILSFAKLQDGRVSVHIERCDARQLAREAHALVEPAADAKGLQLGLDVPEEAVELETDRGKLRQVLINLCGNAVKYTSTGEILLSVTGEADHVLFEVSDTGIGIAPEHQERVFDRFWRVDDTPTASSGGLGIGLAAVREVSRLLSGEVGVESVVGEGSTFRVAVPRVYARPDPDAVVAAVTGMQSSTAQAGDRRARSQDHDLHTPGWP